MTRSFTVVGSAGIAVERRAHALGREQALERRAGLVVADHRQQRRLRAQRRRVARDVGGAAGALLGARDLDHRHRRLGRDALDVAEPVAVEHHVADDQHARARDARRATRRSAVSARFMRAAPSGGRSRSTRARRRGRRAGRTGCGRRRPAAPSAPRAIASKSGLRNSFHSVTTTSASAPASARHRRGREARARGASPNTRRASSIATGS